MLEHPRTPLRCVPGSDAKPGNGNSFLILLQGDADTWSLITMAMRVRCQKCRYLLNLPAEELGQLVRCPKCLHEFHAAGGVPLDEDQPLDVLPVSDPEPSADEPVEVLPVDADDAPGAADSVAVPPILQKQEGGDQSQAVKQEEAFESWYEEEKVPKRYFSGRVIWLCKNKAFPGASVWQRVIMGNLVRTFEQYDLPWLALPVVYAIAPIGAAVLAVAGYLFMMLAYWLFTSVGWLLGDWTDNLPYVVPLLLALAIRYVEPWMQESEVKFEVREGRYDGFDLGRIGDIFRLSMPALLGIFFGLLFGMQVGLIHYTRNHVGLEVEGGLGQSFLLALNNVCHGVFLDTFEIYNINLAGRIQYGFWPGTLFYIFQLGYDLLAALIFYSIYQRYALRKVLRGMPDPNEDSAATWLAWIQNLCAHRNRWSRKFFDEFLFLAMAEAYVRGQFEAVRVIGDQFPRLLVSREVRRMFVGPNGEALFAPEPPRETDSAKP
jgi:hypothetical protein